ncbi:MAG: hypothetical protein Alis3KO_36110 [Aliiglaciecola sp.]|uniref:hypothetical protein n=1 Tax=Aliiglaciecola sp. M165 TaxID=2593649 RepID=UPI0011804628|nr:hypothetical protein [Aliiglaciecola sp. M165]TRY33462.1 hypothetical protein FM019_05670 [Aliiglaciecola sp. M165]
MNINATLLGQLIAVLGLAVFMAAICFYLGKRKTETPILVSAIGFFTAIIPPVALIYLIVLVLKRDLPAAPSNV